MKKTFLNVALISLLTVSMPVSFVSCKDYDDDINSINDKINEITGKTIVDINTTIANLQTALNKAQQDATAAGEAAEAARKLAQQGVDDAAKAQANAVALHQEALQAAAQAKADALAEIAKQAQALKTQIETTEAALQAGIDANKANIDANTAAIAANVTAIAANADAIAKLEASITALELATGEKISALETKLDEKITDVNGKIDATKTSLEELVAAKVEALTAAINAAKSELQNKLDETNANVAALNADLQAAITDLNGKITVVDGKVTAVEGRLTTAEGNIVTLNTNLANLENTVDQQGVLLEEACQQIMTNWMYIQAMYEQLELQAQTITFMNQLISDNADAIAENKEQIEALLADLNDTKELLGALSDNFDQLSMVVNSTVQDLDELKTSVADQFKELWEEMSRKDEELGAAIGNLSTIINDNYEELTKALSDFQEVVASTVENLQNDYIERISKVDAALVTLKVTLNGRLTSVTLVPTAYVGGIPTIDFITFNYSAIAAPDENGFYDKADKAKMVTKVAGNASTAKYRLNPTTVTLDDIVVDGLTYDVLHNVSSRAEDGSLVVTGATIEDGVLNLKVKNTNYDALDNAEGTAAATKISTAALKVPVAKAHLFDGETEAYVYSEYSRICAFEVEPYLLPEESWKPAYEFATLEDAKANVFVNGATADAANTIVGNVLYDQDTKTWTAFDANNSAVGAYDFENEVYIMKAEQYADWGISVEYALPTGMTIDNPLTDTKYDLDKNFEIKDGKVNFIGENVNDVIGSTFPLIITLVDNNEDSKGQIIDVDYAGVFVKLSEKPIEVNFETSYDVFCEKQVAGIDWEWVTNEIFPKLDNITASQFKQIYYGAGESRSKYEGKLTSPKGDVVYNHAMGTETTAEGESFLSDLMFGNMEPSMSNMMLEWTLLSTQFSKIVIGETQQYVGKITLTDRSNTYPNVIINVTLNIDMPTALPVLTAGQKAYWNVYTNAEGEDTGKQFIEMYPSNPAVGGDDVANYKLNILVGRTAPYFVQKDRSLINQFLPCTTWNIDVEEHNGLIVPGTRWMVNGKGSSNNPSNTMPALDVNKQADYTDLTFVIRHNAEGIELVGEAQDNDVVLNANWNINWTGDNEFIAFDNCYIKVIYPLFYTQLSVPTIADNTKPATVSLAKSFNIYDAYKNPVYTGESKKAYFDYYEIESDVLKFYDAANATYSYSEQPAADDALLSSIHVKIAVEQDALGNAILVYTPQSAVIAEDYYIHLPLNVKHRWGVLHGTINILLKATL